MKDLGRMIYRMEMVWRLGQMVQNMKVVIRREKNTGMGNIFGMMNHPMREIGLTTKFVEEAFIAGLMEG